MRALWRTLLYCVVAAVNILSTLLPVWPGRYHLIARGLPLGLILLAQDVTLLVGVAMLLLAYPAARGQKTAAYLLASCAAVAMLSNVLKGLDVEEAVINGCLLVALWRVRGTLRPLPSRYTVVDLARLAIVLVVIVRLYSWLGRVILAQLGALVARGRSVIPDVEPELSHRIAFVLTAKLTLETLWFHESRYLLPLFLVAIFVVFSWTSLARAQLPSLDTQELYERFGRASHNSLAYLARRTDVSTFVDPSGRGVISYRQVGRVALQIGAILAPAPMREAVYRAFCAFCEEQGLIPAAVALANDEAPAARAGGMHTLMLGTEAVVDVTSFTVEHLSKKMRWAHRSLAKRGFSAEIVSAAAITPRQRVALAQIDEEWREQRGGQLHGCCMTLGRFPTPDDPSCLVGLMRGPDGAPIAYLTLLPGGEGYYSLDLTRRIQAAPNATMEFLLMDVLGELQRRGAVAVSLNFSTFSGLSAHPLGQRLLRLCGVAFQLSSLETFNNKFRPVWTPRYVAIPSWYYAPDVLYAVLVVEGVDQMVLNACVRAARHLVAPERVAGAAHQGERA